MEEITFGLISCTQFVMSASRGVKWTGNQACSQRVFRVPKRN